MSNKSKKKSITRIIVSLLFVLVFFCVLLVQLFNIQVIHARDYSARQDSYMLSDITLAATRGDIYDANMNLLAKDASCSMVYAFPNSITDDDATAKFLSEKLGMSYEEVYAKISDKTNSYVYIKRGVDNSTALEIEAADYDGVGTDEDKKRYYTDSSFAQYILGFAGSDHVGLYGIEAAYNDVLNGEDGIKSVLTDSKGAVIESSSSVKKEAKKGDSIVLTIDSVIQYYAESLALSTYQANLPKRVIIMVTNVNTGEILAAAAYPGYSLDDPWSITSDYAQAFSSEIASGDESSVQLNMWKNPFTMYIYEPGSTFKMITVSSALESGVAVTDSGYYCGGFLRIDGVMIKCDVYPGHHGSQNLKEAFVNSCNPAMMTVAQQMGPDTFYEYIYNYGFGETTGLNLDGEEAGIFSVGEDVNMVDFVTLGFGQGIAVTPIQLVRALNAVTNGGYLMEPSLVKYVLDSQSGEIVYENNPQAIRRVISEETSATVCEYMKAAADNYYFLREYREYNIGGKTGTAQKFADGRYLDGKFVASFYGVIPYNDPQISVLVVIDEPSGMYTSGSTIAAPVAANLLVKAYNYLSSRPDLTPETVANAIITVPDVRGKTLEAAAAVFDSFGIAYTTGGDTKGIVVDQSTILTEYQPDQVVTLTLSDSDKETVVVPNVVGMSVKNAADTLASLGLEIEIEGGGIASSQSIKDGTVVEKGTLVKVCFVRVE